MKTNKIIKSIRKGHKKKTPESTALCGKGKNTSDNKSHSTVALFTTIKKKTVKTFARFAFSVKHLRKVQFTSLRVVLM